MATKEPVSAASSAASIASTEVVKISYLPTVARTPFAWVSSHFFYYFLYHNLDSLSTSPSGNFLVSESEAADAVFFAAGNFIEFVDRLFRMSRFFGAKSSRHYLTNSEALLKRILLVPS